MAEFVTDTFTTGSNDLLDAHVGETGATWTKHANSGAGDMTIASTTDRLRVSTSGGRVIYYASGAPTGADYEVASSIYVASTANSFIGVAGRMDTGADTYYTLYHDTGNDQWVLRKVVAGAVTELDNYAQTLVLSTTYAFKLEMVGSTIKGYIDSVEQLSVGDSAITAAGKAGVFGATGGSSGNGVQLVEMTATDIAGAPATVPQRTLVGVGT